ncbi:transposase [Tessaracoccus flavus]|uniref:transposase n=1 Tax=Tessaracoccus flavus TaxID=1610493 RepID=UPI00202A9028|nr:transposase [Tessaracoccus flavus]
MTAAIRRSFQGAAHERCRLHYVRNLLAHVSRAQAEMVAAVFRTTLSQSTHEAVGVTGDQVREHHSLPATRRSEPT